MDSIKSRPNNGPKFPKIIPNMATKKHMEVKYTDDEKKTIVELKKLYLETIKLDVDLQSEIYNLEKSYEKRHNEIFEKRMNILEDFKKRSRASGNDNKNVSNFWLKVLKSSYTEYISKRDEKILTHLLDITSKLHNEPIVKFVIDFHFEPNEFFSNKTLSKTYFLNCLPDPEDPLTYDGAEIYKCEGCQIDWLNNEMSNEKKGFNSFFDFFNPPPLPDDPDDPSYNDVNAILQNDFELGFYIKERVIPKAVMFFTGEIADCQSSDTESDESGEDEEDEEEDESDEADKSAT